MKSKEAIKEVSGIYSFLQKFEGKLYLVLAFIYAFVLASLPLLAFQDRINYLNYATYPEVLLLNYLGSGVSTFLFNEPLWVILNFLLSSFLPPEITLRIIIFIPAFIVAIQIFKKGQYGWVWLLLILLLPMVLKNHVTHLRQGLAVAIFLLGWFQSNKKKQWFFYLITPFIHSSFFIIIGLIIAVEFIKKYNLKRDLASVTQLGLSLFISLSLGAMVSLLGARQANTYSFEAGDISGFGFIFWLGVTLLFFFQGKTHFKKHLFEYTIILFYLCSYFMIETAARIFEGALIPVLLAGFNLTSWRKKAFQSAFVLFFIFQWLVRILKNGAAF